MAWDRLFPNDAIDPPPRWADNGGSITEPSSGKKDVGWITSEKPPAEYFNWWKNLVGRYHQALRDAVAGMMLRNFFAITPPGMVTTSVCAYVSARGSASWTFLHPGAPANSDRTFGSSPIQPNTTAADWDSAAMNMNTPRDACSVVGRMIAVGSGGAIDFSGLGTPHGWTAAVSGTANDLLSVASQMDTDPDSASNEAVACGASDTLLHTTNGGTTWNARTSNLGGSLSSVVWDPVNALWCVVANYGGGNNIATSPDGITWTSRPSPLGSNLQMVAYSNGRLMVVETTAGANRVATSVDGGVNWTLTAGQPSLISSPVGIIGWNGFWMAYKDGSSRLQWQISGDDGANWDALNADGGLGFSPAGEISGLASSQQRIKVGGGRIVVPGDQHFWATLAGTDPL